MDKNKYLLLLVLFIIPFLIMANELPQKHRDQKEWIDKAVKLLIDFKPNSKTKYARLMSNKDGNYHYYEIKHKGVIKFGDNGWVAIICHSFHQDEFNDKDIGDIILAIDHNGNLYRNDGHPCMSIVLKAPTESGFRNIDEFLETKVLKNKSWYNIKIKKP